MLNENHKDVVIMSVPYCEPLPLVAPVLLAGCLESAGITAKGIDFNIHFIKHFSEFNEYEEIKKFLTIGNVFIPSFNIKIYKKIIKFTLKFLKNTVKKYNPTYIGLSIFTSESLDFGIILSYLIRKYFPRIKILAGGKGLEVFANDREKHYEIWHKSLLADLIIVGDAEAEIISAIRDNRRGIVVSTPQTKQDLDKIPLPSWHDYNFDMYSSLNRHSELATNLGQDPYLTVSSSKGCVRKCTFCDVSSFWPEFIYRDPEKVAEEIIFNYKKTGIKRFHFTDNLINGSVSNYRRMNEILISKIPNEIQYRGYAIFRGKYQMPESDFKLAADAGCFLWEVGVESGSEKVRHDIKKKFDNDDLDWSINMLYKYGIAQKWLLMVGYPTESEKDFQDTINLLKRYSHLNNNNMITVQITSFMLLKNSPLLANSTISSEYGLDHVKTTHSSHDKFWTSTVYTDNDFPTRSRRWREILHVSENYGYSLGDFMPLKKWTEELNLLEKIYHEQKRKVIYIRQNS
jgi:radical SAM superfamily enzyme YgiQ (UPF0313 family)